MQCNCYILFVVRLLQPPNMSVELCHFVLLFHLIQCPGFDINNSIFCHLSSAWYIKVFNRRLVEVKQQNVKFIWRQQPCFNCFKYKFTNHTHILYIANIFLYKLYIHVTVFNFLYLFTSTWYILMNVCTWYMWNTFMYICFPVNVGWKFKLSEISATHECVKCD